MNAIERGEQARQVLENETFKSAVQQIEQEVFEQWQRESNPKQREHLWLLLQSQRSLLRALTNAMNAGKVMEADLKRKGAIGRILSLS